MTEPMLAPAGPVFTVDGERVPSLARDCVRLEIEEGVEGLRTLRLHLFATGPGPPGPPDRMIYLDGGVVDFGKQLDGRRSARTAASGPSSTATISAIEAVFDDGEPPLVVILAEDALMRLRMTRRMRTYTDVTDADIASAAGRRARAAGRGRRRRAALRRRPAAQPERPGLPAGTGPAGAGRAVVRRAHPALELAAHAGRGPSSPWSRATTCSRCGCAPTWPTSAARSWSPATTPRPRT